MLASPLLSICEFHFNVFFTGSQIKRPCSEIVRNSSSKVGGMVGNCSKAELLARDNELCCSFQETTVQ